MRRPRVLLGDDHQILLQGLRELLAPEFEVVGTATDGRALLVSAERLRPDVIVFDISMPVLNGIEAARRLKETNPEAKLVCLTMHSDASLLNAALEAGVSAYVLKAAAASELTAAIGRALKGRSYVSRGLAGITERHPGRLPAASATVPLELTPRQREVLQLVAEGRTLKEIATLLGLSVKTVEFHKCRIMDRLGVRTAAELTQYAVRHRIVSV